MRDLNGKVAIVTASTSGIGLAIVRRLGQEGVKVMLSSRKQKNVDGAVASLRGEGLEVTGCVCHVGTAEHRKTLVSRTLEAYGQVDILVSNAAVNPATGAITEQSESVIDKILNVNIKAAILLVQEVSPHLREGSSIVFVSSQMGLQPAPPLGIYGVSKTALLGLTKALALEMGPTGVRVNSVLPGIVPTHFAGTLIESGLGEAMRAATPLGRLGRPEDIAAVVAFLASSDSGFVTGENHLINGGCTMMTSR
eukprot:CAMPEP_0117688734 /NCGR_PEP_ID=MMETSP0804-20121206/24027_1 /TAXON_ID=1074897 /ORGANISM="Tetraselmis astigmatica, Strain CCMP880" /LENGTH=251 /DNA_ID=CAMNT_0005501285 /DNA_START=173 /DNA_END=924 /DNA_ORIENTATION=+